MNITSVMPKLHYDVSNPEMLSKNISYLISSHKKMLLFQEEGIGILLLHNTSKKNISMEIAIREYSKISHSILYVTNMDGSMVNEHIQNQFPSVSFLCVKKEMSKKEKDISIGSLINILFKEMQIPTIFVSWTDIDPFGISTSLFTKYEQEMPLCISPVFEDKNGEFIPTAYDAKINNVTMSIKTRNTYLEHTNTFIPYKFIGIYNRKKMISLGGFEEDIHNPFLQLLEFSLRAYVKGERMQVNSFYRVRDILFSSFFNKKRNQHCDFKDILSMPSKHSFLLSLFPLFLKNCWNALKRNKKKKNSFYGNTFEQRYIIRYVRKNKKKLKENL